MLIRYLGPSPSVNVGGFEPHTKGQDVDYPADVGEELLATAKKQRFEAVTGKPKEKPPAKSPAKPKEKVAEKPTPVKK